MVNISLSPVIMMIHCSRLEQSISTSCVSSQEITNLWSKTVSMLVIMDSLGAVSFLRIVVMVNIPLNFERIMFALTLWGAVQCPIVITQQKCDQDIFLLVLLQFILTVMYSIRDPYSSLLNFRDNVFMAFVLTIGRSLCFLILCQPRISWHGNDLAYAVQVS